MASCPDCGGTLIRHPDDSPHKGGLYHCDTCGQCGVTPKVEKKPEEVTPPRVQHRSPTRR